MENALLIGLSRQMALQNQMSVIANNVANSGTAGYKADTLRFQEYLMPVANVEETTGPESELSYVVDYDVIRHLEAGSLRATGNTFDAALNGDGWFTIQTATGERYTRDGHFALDAEGTLVNASGQPVLGEGGTINVAPDETDFAIAPDGTVSTSAGEKGKLRIVNFDDPAAMQKEGDNLYLASAAPNPAQNFRVAQGYIEESNVQAVTEIANMVQVQRAYISTARQLESMAELKKQAIEQLGRVEA